ncbi:MAG TPA: SDR family oxidoreductase [Mycobacteriales bacterium]|nr:SDR family oxidoreductase [Mycobacteriales bacterium]
MSGRVVIITGGSSGIGLATLTRFARGGDQVVNLDLRPPADPTTAAGWLEVDVTDWAGVDRAVDTVVERHGAVDVAVANAGISIRHRVVDITEEEFRRVLDVNLSGVFALWRACARHMLVQRSGVLLATASTNGTAGYPYYADYNASKAGVLALCRSFALELSPHVRTGAVSPGYVMTPMQRSEYTDEMLAEVNSHIPLGRHADPAEIANMFHFLASADAAYLTGQQIIVDGGELAGGIASTFGTLTRPDAPSG